MIILNDSVSSNEFQDIMQAQVEKVIIKVSPLLSDSMKMGSDAISSFKDYTMYYYKVSPNAFFIENEFYQDLTENL
jgi:hypothetical protein